MREDIAVKLTVAQVLGLLQSEDLPAEAIVTEKIADGAVTVSKIQDLAAATVLLRAAGTGSGPPIAGTAAQLRSIVGSATEDLAALVELATSAETQAGTDAVRAVTPAGLASRTATDDRTGLVELATNAEAATGTDTVRAVTPAAMASALNTRSAAFVAASNANQAVANGVTKITLGNVLTNIGSAFATSTFTAPRAGVYHFDLSVTLIDGTADTGNWGPRIVVNGTSLYEVITSKHRSYSGASISATLNLAAGNTVEGWVLLDSLAGSPLLAAGRCIFSGHFVG